MDDLKRTPCENDAHFMGEAIAEAERAAAGGEVPIGAVVVKAGKIIGRGGNRVIAEGDATAHAEMIALKGAAAATADRLLTGATLYVTLEPCPMCAFAAVLARVGRIVFGAADPKFGGCGSVVNILTAPFNHHVAVTAGVRADECAAILKRFFAAKRESAGR